ncbi:MAG: Holliday junction resolvase RuvX [Bradymonadaceae bacterium]
MNRYLGVDVGSRRVGLAISDPLNSMALPLETADGSKPREAAKRIVELVQEYDVGALVVGWPVEMSGQEGRAARTVGKFIEVLDVALDRRGLDVQIHKWDERLTTHAAQSLLIEADVSRRRRKETVDQIAAAHILQGYLDSLRIQEARKREDEEYGD